MGSKRFKAFRVYEEQSGSFKHVVEDRSIDDLPNEGVLIRVHYSSLNYKDALSACIHKGITRSYPHTPGIDAAGIVEDPGESDFNHGDPVIVTSYDLGMNTPGGFGRYIRVPADWIVSLPQGLSLRESMILGTAGFTAGLAFWRLESGGIEPQTHPDLLVTGATGGVGSLSVIMGSSTGYNVHAITGKQDHHDFLKKLGANRIFARKELSGQTDQPLLNRRWNAGIDTVGGPPLANLLKSIHMDGAVACCGNVAGDHLAVSLYPFILRGISLMGIDSGNCRMSRRLTIWKRLATQWKPGSQILEQITTVRTLESLSDTIQSMLDGQLSGRVLIDLGGKE